MFPEQERFRAMRRRLPDFERSRRKKLPLPIKKKLTLVQAGLSLVREAIISQFRGETKDFYAGEHKKLLFRQVSAQNVSYFTGPAQNLRRGTI